MTRRNDAMSYAPVSVIVLLMSFFYLILMVTLIPPLGSTDVTFPVNSMYPNSDVVNVIVTNILFLLMLVSFLRASFTSPGSVPEIFPWDPDCVPPKERVEGADEDSVEVTMERALREKGVRNVRGLERKMDGRARFCRMCGRYKPDRTHHSSNMGECILEMDHYCPWIRNCVGYLNKKYFFLLILYGAMALIAFCVSLGPRFVYACQHMASGLDFFIVFSWILAAMMGTVVTTFVFFHVYLMSFAYTTIEYCEKRRADASKRNAHGYSIKELYEKSPYDLGIYHNVCHVLGPWYVWLVPVRWGMASDVSAGCIFQVNPAHPLYKSAFGDAEANPARNDAREASVTPARQNQDQESDEKDSLVSSSSSS